jgi:hypothetical protein
MASDDFLGDVYYEVWRRGGNPDRVDEDRVLDCMYDGRSAEECADRYMSEVWRRRERREQEEAERRLWEDSDGE